MRLIRPDYLYASLLYVALSAAALAIAWLLVDALGGPVPRTLSRTVAGFFA